MFALWTLCLVSLWTSGQGESTSGELITGQGWLYLDVFNFATGKVSFKYSISYPRIYAPVRLLFYTFEQFATANDSAKSCEQKVSSLSEWMNSKQVLELDSTRQSSGCYNRYVEGRDMVYCTGRFHISTDIMGPWFVVANRCGSQNGVAGLSIKYYIDNIVDQVVNDLWPLLSGQESTIHSIPLLTTLSTLVMVGAALLM